MGFLTFKTDLFVCCAEHKFLYIFQTYTLLNGVPFAILFETTHLTHKIILPNTVIYEKEKKNKSKNKCFWVKSLNF